MVNYRKNQISVQANPRPIPNEAARFQPANQEAVGANNQRSSFHSKFDTDPDHMPDANIPPIPFAKGDKTLIRKKGILEIRSNKTNKKIDIIKKYRN